MLKQGGGDHPSQHTRQRLMAFLNTFSSGRCGLVLVLFLISHHQKSPHGRRKFRRLSEINSGALSSVGLERETNIHPLLTMRDSPTQSEGHNQSQAQFEVDPTINEEEEEVQAVQGSAVPRVSFGSDDSGDELEKDSLGRQRIRPKGNTFQDCGEDILGVITHNIQSHFDGPWTSLSKVPNDVKELWWAEFQKQFYWRDRHAPRVKKVWRSKCSQHIRNMMCDHRASGMKPGFLSPENWAAMLDHWRNDDKYKRSSEQNKISRASEGRRGKSKYGGGSKSVVQKVDKKEKEIGRRLTQEELMNLMYHSEKKGIWLGDRPQKDMDSFNKLCIEWKESHPGEEMSQDQINKLWLIATGGECNGRISGQGSLYRKMDNVLNPATPTPSAQRLQPSPPLSSPTQVRSSSTPIPTCPLPRCNSPTPLVASPSRFENSMEARIQRQDEIIEQLVQQLHQERQPRQPTPLPRMSFQPMSTPSSGMSFQPMHMPSSNISFQTIPTSNVSFPAMPPSNMSYQAMLQSTEPSVYQDMSVGMFAPNGGAYGDGAARQN